MSSTAWAGPAAIRAPRSMRGGRAAEHLIIVMQFRAYLIVIPLARYASWP